MALDRKLDNRRATLPLKLVESNFNLDQLLRLAAQYHLGGLKLTDDELSGLIKQIKKNGMVELDLGDGRKIESVRVERKLDGSVCIFFGI
jgi:hypothetical protein